MKKFGLINVILNLNDIFVPFKSKEHSKHFVNYINSKHKNIKFIFETKDSNNFSKLRAKTNGLLHRIFANKHLMEFSPITIFFAFDTYKIGLVQTILFRFFIIYSSM